MSRLQDIDARAAGSLKHPVRMAVLWALEAGPASPSELARVIGAPLEAVSYHVRKMHQLGILDAEEPELLEGVVRHPYRLAVRPRIGAAAWEALTMDDRDYLAGAVLHRAMRDAVAAVGEGGMRRPDCHVGRRNLTLDEEAFRDISALIEQTVEHILTIEASAIERLANSRSRQIDATFVGLLFERVAEDRSVDRLQVPRQQRAVDGRPSHSRAADGRA